MAGQAGTGRARSAWHRSLAGSRRCGSHWDVTDLYPDFATRLRASVESAEPFWLMWWAGKVPRCATVERATTRGPLLVIVREFAGDADLLTDSVIWSAFGENAYAASGRAALRKAGFGELAWDSVQSMLRSQGLFDATSGASAEALLFCETSCGELLDELADCERRAAAAQEERYQRAVASTVPVIKRWYATASGGSVGAREAARAAPSRSARRAGCRAQHAS